jgi:hypothetical protein
LRGLTYEAGRAAVEENFVAKNTLDIFHVQTSEAKSFPNLDSQVWRETE